MNIDRRLDDLESEIYSNQEVYPDIVIHLGWEPEEKYITVDGEIMLMSELDRRFPGWNRLPVNVNISWGDDD